MLANLLLLAGLTSTDVTYTIPASEKLDEPMTLAIQDAYFIQNESSVEMGFRLPEALTGKNGQFFTLSGTLLQNKVSLEGESVLANCETSLIKTDCIVSFQDLKLEKPLTSNPELKMPKDILESINVGREALEHQAIGVITFVHK